MERHVRQQHSNNPQWFSCSICEKVMTTTRNLRFHLETIHVDQKPSFACLYCDAKLTWKENRQAHMRRVHGLKGREKQVNLYLHLQQLSEESDFKNEWMFVESRPIQAGERNVCLCGQTPIKTYFFLVNKINGNRTFVGSTCIGNIAPEAAAVISYFEYILQHGIQGTYKGQAKHGLQIFTVKAKTKLVSSLPIVKHLNPPVQENQEGEWQLTVMFPQTESLLEGQKYWLNLKAKYRQSYILSKFHKIVDKIMLKCISAPEAADPNNAWRFSSKAV